MDQEKINRWKLGSPELGTGHLGINEKDHLTVKAYGREYDIYELAKIHGTPLEIVVPEVVINQVMWLRRCFETSINKFEYTGSYNHCYPLKSNPLPDIVRSAIAGGASLEVGTDPEAYVAEKLYRKRQIAKDSIVICNGAKENNYLERILTLQKDDYNAVPVIEAEQEYHLICGLASKIGLDEVDVGLRVRTGIDLGDATHWNSATEQNPFGLRKDDTINFVKRELCGNKKMNLKILHCHAGSQIVSLEGIIKAVDAVADTYAKLKSSGAKNLEYLNIGGGLPTTYDKTKPLFSIQDYADSVVSTIKTKCQLKKLSHPNIIVEAGRWSCAPAQITIFGTFYTKPVRDELRFIRIDGSLMTDLPDTWGVSQDFWIVPVNGLGNTNMKPYWLAGMTCDSDDVYPPKNHSGKKFEDLPRIYLPNVDENCRYQGYKFCIAVLDTGAYQDALSGTKGVKHCMLPDSKKSKLTPEGKLEPIFDRTSAGELARRLGWKF